MRAMFREFSHSLKDGIYIFVAKAALFDTSHEKFHNDFKKVLSRAQTITA
jgi:ribonuclease P protein component